MEEALFLPAGGHPVVVAAIPAAAADRRMQLPPIIGAAAAAHSTVERARRISSLRTPVTAGLLLPGFVMSI